MLLRSHVFLLLITVSFYLSSSLTSEHVAAYTASISSPEGILSGIYDIYENKYHQNFGTNQSIAASL